MVTTMNKSAEASGPTVEISAEAWAQSSDDERRRAIELIKERFRGMLIRIRVVPQ